MVCSHKHVFAFMPKVILFIALSLLFALPAYSQNIFFSKDRSDLKLNPLFYFSNKQTLKQNPNLTEHFKSPRHQLMYWPAYYLTADQIKERDKKYDRPKGEQIADEIIETYINALISAKNKKPVAKVPKF